MAHRYALVMPDTNMSGSGIIAAIRPGAAFGMRLVRAWVAQRGTATSAQYLVQFGFKASAFPTLTTGVTPVKLDERDPASLFTSGTALAAGTCGVLATTEGAGTFTPIITDDWNNLSGWQYVPSPDEIIIAKAGSADAFALRVTLPGAVNTVSGGFIFEEV